MDHCACIAALGFGIAIATSKHGEDHKHDSKWDGNLYVDPFSPGDNMTCVPPQTAILLFRRANGFF